MFCNAIKSNDQKFNDINITNFICHLFFSIALQIKVPTGIEIIVGVTKAIP
jgi:hypothetical protein